MKINKTTGPPVKKSKWYWEISISTDRLKDFWYGLKHLIQRRFR